MPAGKHSLKERPLEADSKSALRMWDECFLFSLEKQRTKRKRIEKELRRKPKQNIFQVINFGSIYKASELVEPAGLEPATRWLWVTCSDRLSYGSYSKYSCMKQYFPRLVYYTRSFWKDKISFDYFWEKAEMPPKKWLLLHCASSSGPSVHLKASEQKNRKFKCAALLRLKWKLSKVSSFFSKLRFTKTKKRI